MIDSEMNGHAWKDQKGCFHIVLVLLIIVLIAGCAF
jgi:hypothetical protein